MKIAAVSILPEGRVRVVFIQTDEPAKDERRWIEQCITESHKALAP